MCDRSEQPAELAPDQKETRTMKRNIISICALTLVWGVQAQATSTDCSALGLSNTYLSDLFCSELEALAGTTGATRSITQEGNPDSDNPVAEWEQIGLIQDAYRADPRKTLELIERIKGAGGLTAVENN